MLKSCSGPGPKSSHHLEHSEVPEGSSPKQVSEMLWAAVALVGSASEQSSLCLPSVQESSLEDCVGVEVTCYDLGLLMS